jgi:hypothetical protein
LKTRTIACAPFAGTTEEILRGGRCQNAAIL